MILSGSFPTALSDIGKTYHRLYRELPLPLLGVQIRLVAYCLPDGGECDGGEDNHISALNSGTRT
jgi:hypothetical protein